MFSAILILCSLELNTCQTVSNPALFANMNVCLQALALGFNAAEENGLTIVDYTCIDWETKDPKINTDKLH